MQTQQVAQQLAESIINATAVLHNPGSAAGQRAEAVQFFEQVTGGPKRLLPMLPPAHSACFTMDQAPKSSASTRVSSAPAAALQRLADCAWPSPFTACSSSKAKSMPQCMRLRCSRALAMPWRCRCLHTACFNTWWASLVGNRGGQGSQAHAVTALPHGAAFAWRRMRALACVNSGSASAPPLAHAEACVRHAGRGEA